MNISFVQDQIAKKLNYNRPYYASYEIKHILTDHDHFPYKRFYRGNHTSSKPIVMEREAGYRARQDDCYVPQVVITSHKPEYCWQTPCSHVKPCRPNNDSKPSYVITP